VTVRDLNRQRLKELVTWKPVKALLVAGLLVGGLMAARHTGMTEYVPFSGASWAIVAYAAVGAFIGYDSGIPRNEIARVQIRGQITRDTGLLADGETDAESVCEAIDVADSGHQQALLVDINSPGGEPTASEDIHDAIEAFDGPTVAVAHDSCASGAYMIASACDHIITRESTRVGSIGVIGSQPNVSELADRLGVDYERFAAGEYKDAGMPLSETDDDERDYLQGLVNGFYDRFVDVVAAGRPLSPEAIRDTEARMYLGTEAQSLGLVDSFGGIEDGVSYLAQQLQTSPDDVTVGEWEEKGLLSGAGASVQQSAYALGCGIGHGLSIDASTISEFKFN